MKRIVFVTRSLKAGGAERVIAQLVKYLVKKDIICSIITIDNCEVFYDLPSNVKIIAIGERTSIRYLDKFLRYKEVRRYIKELTPDIVLALPEEIGIFVIPTLFGTGIPVVVSERNNPWIMPWKKPTRILRKIFYPFSAGVIFQTKQAASYFSKCIREKSIVLPNPLDLKRIPQPFVGERRKEIVGVGRLVAQKNFPLLIKAFSEFHKNHSDYILTIYGEGESRGELENLAASCLPQGSYFFAGEVKNLLEKINGAAMFVLSSNYEGMPNVVIEAMAIGLPVIATDCPSGGPASLIDDGINGLLVPVNDVNALMDAMSKVAGSNEFASMLGKNAQKIREKLDSDIVAEQWRNYLDAVSR